MEYIDFINEIRKPRQKNTYNRAEDVLTDVTNYMLGITYRCFKKGEINYKELKENIEELDFKLDIILEKPSKFKKTSLEEYNKRKQNEEYLPIDIRGLLLSDRRQKNIIFYYDKPIIKIMASFDDEEAINKMDELTKIDRQNTSYYRKVGKNR